MSDTTDPKSEALRVFALAVYAGRGRVDEADLQAFRALGFTEAQALDVVANIAVKVMSNFANQVALTPIDEPFAPLVEDLPFKEDRSLQGAE